MDNAREYGNRAAARAFSPPPTEKNYKWVYGSRPLSATTESASQQASKEEPDAAGEAGASEGQFQEIIESLTKEKESLSKKIADFQLNSTIPSEPYSVPFDYRR
ncbi:hypothetical protein E2C01_014704 [Portunus trituberculatus]|uniref:Uncharacterized protein n=1 Tax=Portunus trituberculatus TaxID=210409 RepID=A0A5B7DJI9_PORTR|nr:hypothetical protein [Portunus trituberculatus]